MKLLNLLSLTAFVVVGVATPALDLPGSLTSTTIVTSTSTLAKVNHHLTENRPITVATRADPINGDNQQSVASQAEGGAVVIVSIRDKMPQKIGTTKDGALYRQIYEALSSLCPSGTSDCKTSSAKPPQIPSDSGSRFQFPIIIPCASFCTTKYFTIWVERGHYSKDEIRRLLIGSIAGAIEATNNDSNCAHGICNVPAYVGVRASNGDILDVWFKSGGDPTWKPFVCSSILDETKRKMNVLKAEFNAVVGPGDVSVGCQP